MAWPWNLGLESLKVIESGAVRQDHVWLSISPPCQITRKCTIDNPAGEMELHVVSTLMVLYAMFHYDVAHKTTVDDEQ